MAFVSSVHLRDKARRLRLSAKNAPHKEIDAQYVQLIPSAIGYELETLLQEVETKSDPIPAAYQDLLFRHNHLQKNILTLREEISGMFPGDHLKSQIMDYLDEFIAENIGGE